MTWGRRAFVRVEGRRVHLRTLGRGPAVLLLHGSPQASRAVEGAARAVAAMGLCAIAPDTPGNGRSDPLPDAAPDAEAYARALAALCDRLGLRRVGLYGFHTGAATSCVFGALFPDRTAALALDGLPAWTEAERARLLDGYLPPFAPAWDGSHMAWLWARMEEQTLFFPWHAPEPWARMDYDVSAPAHVHANCMDLLDAGDAHRPAYRAAFAFRAEAWTDRLTAPALIAATAADVLREHLDRPGVAGRGTVLADAPALWAAAATRLAEFPGDPAPDGFERAEEGFGFVDLGGERLAWSGPPGARSLWLHDAGGRREEVSAADALAIDLPGHGDSAEGWRAAPGSLDDWADTVRAAVRALGVETIRGEGFGARIAARLDPTAPPPPDAPEAMTPPPSLAPEWDGTHLVRAWRIARWQRLFRPWWRRDRAHALKPYGEMSPDAVHARAVALLKAGDRWSAAEAAR